MRGVFLLLVCAFVGCDCNKKPDAAPKTDTSAPVASASAPLTTDEEDLCQGQPYARRCDKACKDAQQTAFNKTCAKETAAFSGGTDATFGKCMTACRVKNADSTCVGAADRGVCDCTLKCYRALPKEQLDKARAAARCYHKEIAGPCG